MQAKGTKSLTEVDLVPLACEDVVKKTINNAVNFCFFFLQPMEEVVFITTNQEIEIISVVAVSCKSAAKAYFRGERRENQVTDFQKHVNSDQSWLIFSVSVD